MILASPTIGHSQLEELLEVRNSTQLGSHQRGFCHFKNTIHKIWCQFLSEFRSQWLKVQIKNLNPLNLVECSLCQIHAASEFSLLIWKCLSQLTQAKQEQSTTTNNNWCQLTKSVNSWQQWTTLDNSQQQLLRSDNSWPQLTTLVSKQEQLTTTNNNWRQLTKSDNIWQQLTDDAWQQFTKTDNNWQRVSKNWPHLTTVNNNWQQLTKSDNNWQRATTIVKS